MMAGQNTTMGKSTAVQISTVVGWNVVVGWSVETRPTGAVNSFTKWQQGDVIDAVCMMVVHLQSPGVPRMTFDLGFANVGQRTP